MPGVFEVARSVSIGRAIEDILLLVDYSLDGEWKARSATCPCRTRHHNPNPSGPTPTCGFSLSWNTRVLGRVCKLQHKRVPRYPHRPVVLTTLLIASR